MNEKPLRCVCGEKPEIRPSCILNDYASPASLRCKCGRWTFGFTITFRNADGSCDELKSQELSDSSAVIEWNKSIKEERRKKK